MKDRSKPRHFRHALIVIGVLSAIGVAFLLLAHEKPSADESRKSNDDPNEKPGMASHSDLKSRGGPSSGNAENRPMPFPLMGEFESVRSSIDPELARRLLARCDSEIVNIDARSRLCAMIIEALCIRGFAKEAWDLLAQDPGDVRSTELSSFFHTRNLAFDARLDFLSMLSSGSDRAWAIGGLINVPTENMHEVDFSKIPIHSINEKNTVSSFIVNTLNALGRRDSKIENGQECSRILMDKASELFLDRKLDASHIGRIIQADAFNDGFYHWDFLNKFKNRVPPRDIESLEASTLSPMIQEDAGRAINLVFSDPYSNQSGIVISRAMELWYGSDSQRANTWVKDNAANQSSESKDLIYASVARVAIHDGDFETAKQWAGQVSSESLKEKVESAISAAQKSNQQ